MAFTYGLYIKPYIFYTIIVIAIVGSLTCSYMLLAKSLGFVKTCVDFHTQEDAQKAFEQHTIKYARLDADKNGIACQTTYY